MSKRPIPTAYKHRASGLILLALLSLWVSSQAGANDATPEHARLAAALRQLDSIERIVAQQAAQPLDESARFHFDYARLSADLERVRAGIRDYLIPTRAQPRDPLQLLGDYRQGEAAITATEAAP
ncbi:RAQPRD family integrative conjugative element protein [Pseudomonas monteilii]|uniref:integrative conjugative element protein, RAQPRD family n=1 Tax=Pseudomonas TaxID=286 RepID=UPI0023639C96|nr:RAQPRD family integrative conjugative element protein [Pseudomonas monteilii]MDD2127005.1 RAQPRD family integrative conjugative element protein [Pseudomonas monteilii]